MKQEFAEYIPEQLLEEKSFISWVLREENNQEWEEFLATHPGMKSKVNQARNIINLLNDHYDLLDEQSVHDLWLNIERFENCLLYTSPSPRDRTRSRMPSSA